MRLDHFFLGESRGNWAFWVDPFVSGRGFCIKGTILISFLPRNPCFYWFGNEIFTVLLRSVCVCFAVLSIVCVCVCVFYLVLQSDRCEYFLWWNCLLIDGLCPLWWMIVAFCERKPWLNFEQRECCMRLSILTVVQICSYDSAFSAHPF